MRDVGTLVWVVLVVIGVISSIASSVRKAARSQPAPAVRAPRGIAPQSRAAPSIIAPPPEAPSAAPRQVAPRPAPPARAEAEHAAHPGAPARRRRPIFAGKNELVRAVIAAEVLGKPRGLRDEHLIG